MLKPRPYAPYCSGVIQRASRNPSTKFDPAIRPYSRMAKPPLVPHRTIFCIFALPAMFEAPSWAPSGVSGSTAEFVFMFSGNGLS